MSIETPRAGIPITRDIAVLASALKEEGRLGDDLEVLIDQHLVEIRRKESLVVMISSGSLRSGVLGPYLGRLAEGRAGVLIAGDDQRTELAELPPRVIASIIHQKPSADALYSAIEGLLERVELRHHHERSGKWLRRYRYELGELIEIARAITQERDIERLLDLILEKSRFVTGADAGSIYVVEGTAPNVRDRLLRFKLSQNESLAFESREFTMPVSDRSIAGHVVLQRKTLNIPDVYEIPRDAPYGFDRSFDEKVGYRTRSMIAVPMISAEDEVIGVIQLINRKQAPDKRLTTKDDFQSEVIAFDERNEELLESLASQAGIALENALLYDEIRRIFEGFVRASVQAIEQRDPTTSGHSLRVSVLSCALAEKLDRVDDGPFASITFTRRDMKELEYASLLHDFGKIGVREQVLVKAKKLYPHEYEAVEQRILYAIKTSEEEALRRRVELVSRGASPDEIERLEQELEARRAELTSAFQLIAQANEPTVLKEGDFTRIAEIARTTFVDGKGVTQPLLTEREVESLQVTRGSLNNNEIDEIRSHVVHTYNFLAQIPWGKSFSRVPIIAGAHHEKLDGTGYPNRLSATEIPLQSKIMTIADIYDALTARDRPYKKAVPVERALDILGFEVEAGHVDVELVRIFREAEVFRAVDRELAY